MKERGKVPEPQIAPKIRRGIPVESAEQTMASHSQEIRASVSGQQKIVSPLKSPVNGIIDCDETFTSSLTMNVSSPQLQEFPQPQSQSNQNGRLRIARKPPKNKSIYVSRLDVDTDANEIKSYLQAVAGSDILEEVKIFKLNCRSRYFSSFKIICPEALFDKILGFLNEDGVVAREFIYKTTSLTSLPASSKNRISSPVITAMQAE